ncbi:helix-turn-helix domain-containing protein [Antricoccus suffuscus]|uniref:helix-turn-helix domain-containing protein n=1 Tax=Antricoccus suffuscus TaxID=1629062 RepID=UPI001473FF5F|nr:AraC family transcriptional regulator [Antricoccus suffuscus]
MTSEPAPVERDSRGILDPWMLRQRLTLNRYPVPETLAGLVDRFWTVQWDLPAGSVHTQHILTHPGGNLSVSHPDARDASAPVIERSPEAVFNGVATSLMTRHLAGRGWAVAAMTTPGGLGAFICGSVAEFTNKEVPLGQVLAIDETGLVRRLVNAPDDGARVELLAGALEGALVPHRAETARQVAAVARLAETDRSIRRLADLASRAGISSRTLQRLFSQYAGVSPSWMLRRYRLLDVAETVRNGERPSWAQVAADLGYADQAHLVRDFHAATGRTPASYAASLAR